MSFEFIKAENEGHITTITLNRPEVRNAINPAMHAEMQRALDAFAADGDQYICVITGAGERAFCAGSDLKAAAKAGISGQYPKNGYAGLIERFDLFKPVIAAVNGVALGGGFEVALSCDIIIASENAKFGLPEPRVGAVALGGGLHRLARQIGLKQAMGMILSAESITARQAEAFGLVNEVVPQADLRAATARWCEKILKCAPVAIRASKETVMRGLDEPTLHSTMENQKAYPGFVAWRNAEDTAEGPRAFAEKRAPQWKGR
jgi:crotonobetainyl-CoA hydratase